MALQFNRDLVRKYDRPGPRYTSYPTAPHFRDDFGAEDFRALVAAGNDDPIPRPLSLYLHVPFCTSPCFYCACHRIITRDSSRADAYLARLKREIALQARLVDSDRQVTQVHFGGGTPNFLSVDQLAGVLDVIASRFRLAAPDKREIAIEVDPRHVSPKDLDRLASEGFNRLSFGIQDFDPAVQQAVNRIQPAGETLALIEAAHRLGFHSTNVDLIYGLPRQNLPGFHRTLEQVCSVRPQRIALYGYAHMPERFKAQRHIVSEELPSPQQRLELFQHAVEFLDQAGYLYIGMDHFALPEDPLAKAQREGTLIRNFQGYATGANTDILAMGVTGISQLGNGFAQNTTDLETYYRCIDAGTLAINRGLMLDDDDRLRADLIQSVMCHGRIRFAELEARHHIRFREYFRPELEELAELENDGLVEMLRDEIRVTGQGRLLLRHIAMVFDAHHRSRMEQARYSRII